MAPMAAGLASPIDRAPTAAAPMQPGAGAPVAVTDAFAKDAILSWFRGEFAAANAMIDALCAHLAELSCGGGGGGSEYEAVFAAIHQRRLNWIPVLQMQKYHSIADVAMELRKVTEKKALAAAGEGERRVVEETKEAEKERVMENGDGEVVDEEEEEEDSPDSDITDLGSQEVQPTIEDVDICSNHEECSARPDQIKLTKGFSAKEQVKGHMVNVVKGLKLYEDVFTDSELSKLTKFVNELRIAGQKGELSGDTFILFNKQMKGNKRELIQFGNPIFGHIKEEAASKNNLGNIEPIPALLEGVIDHLIQWKLIPEYKKPNGCIIHYFDEEEYSQPFLKPPHLDQPISTLLLSESAMAFGRSLSSDGEGNYRGPLVLPLKEGSLLVMRGNSADMAGHVMCPSSSKRVSITFFRVRPESNHQSSPTSPMAGAVTLWQPAIPSPYPLPNGTPNGYDTMEMIPSWGVVRTPVVMLSPMHPMALSPKKMPNGGTGVFLPWAVGSRKPTKHLPPRAQKGRFLALSSPVQTHVADSGSESGTNVEMKAA